MPNIYSSSKWLTCMTPLTKSRRDTWVKAQSTTTSLFGQRPQQPHLPSLPYKTIAYQFHSSKTSWRSACWDEWWITPSCLVSPPQPWSPQPAWTPPSTRRPGTSWRSSWLAVPPFRPSRTRDTLKVPKKQQQHSKCFRFHFFCGKLKRCYKQQRFGNVMTAVKKHTSVLFFLTTACRLRLEPYIWMHHVSFGVFLVIYFTFKTFGLRHQSPVFTHKSGIYDSFSPSVP